MSETSPARTGPEINGVPTLVRERLGDAADLLVGASSILHLQAGAVSDGGDGLCLVTTAVLGHYTVSMLDETVQAVRGRYNGVDHWWVEHSGVRFDPTRSQFDGGDRFMLIEEHAQHYQSEETFPAGWVTLDLVVAEAQRAFAFPEAAEVFVMGAWDEIMGMHQAAADLG
jgi:hypothetical protein